MLLEYFQMIDAVEQLDPDEGTIIARADVPVESTVFEGHFPGSPLVPGVLLIETMAQASGFMLLSRLKFEKMPFLANVSSIFGRLSSSSDCILFGMERSAIPTEPFWK